MKKILFGLTILLLSLYPLFTIDEIEPEDPEILLPPMLLEIEDITEETVDAALPEDEELLLPVIEMLLPEAEDLEIEDDVFDIPLADQEYPGLKPEFSFFSEGMIGAGNRNQIIGDVTLYKLGEEPRFSIHFRHSGIDGFGTHAAGEGFFQREDTLDGVLSYSLNSLSSGVKVVYEERETGLQQMGDFYSVNHRFFNAEAELIYSFPTNLKVSGGIRGEGVDSILSGETPQGMTEINIGPSFNVFLEFPGIQTSLSAYYTFKTLLNTDISSHKVNTAVDFSAELPFMLDAGGRVNMQWLAGNDILWPFNLYLSGSLNEVFSFRFEGGFRSILWNDTNLLKEYPLLYFTDNTGNSLQLTDSSGWFGEADLQLIPFQQLQIKANILLENPNGNIIPLFTSPDNQTGLFPFTQESLMMLTVSSGIELEPLTGLSFGAEWEGQLLESRNPLKAIHSIGIEAAYNDAAGIFGGNITGILDYNNGFEIPHLNAEIFFRITEGVIIILNGADLLSPLIPAGRTGWGEYSEPGYTLVLQTKISL